MDMDVQERMPGDAEAAAAIAALNLGSWSVGDRLHFAIPGERTRAARVTLIRDDEWLCVEAEDGSGFYSIAPNWVRGF